MKMFFNEWQLPTKRSDTIILAMADLQTTGNNSEMLRILWKVLFMIEKRIFSNELPSRAKDYSDLFKSQAPLDKIK